ncbi:MAG: fatty acid desaturase [Chlamydiales bacterium]|nr:fatty acid desaturase [Chlamydiales bacterium]
MAQMEQKGFNWSSGLFIIIYHVALAIALPIYLWFHGISWSMVAFSAVLLYATGLSITAGYHRFYAHRSYRTNKFVESALLFFGAMSAQGSALRWSYEHRLHHAHTDTDSDPYSIKKGFWYAHFLWLFDREKNIEPRVVSDLLRNRLVVLQDKYLPWLLLATNALVIGLVGWFYQDFWGAFIIAGLTRLFFLHHFTWFINSLAHTWGSRNFCQELSAVDNYVLSLLTFGEGYHNYHHAYANDYRNGVRWYHFDPTKWLIWTLSKLGLAHDLKRTDPLTVQKRMVIERRKLLLDRVKELWYVQKEELEQQIQEMSETIVAHTATLRQLHDRYQAYKAEQAGKDVLSEVYAEIRLVQDEMREDWRRWCALSKDILGLKPLTLLKQ